METRGVPAHSSVLQELEDLRSLLDQSPTRYKPFTSITAQFTPPASIRHGSTAPYNQALNVAERSVDRLGRAIEAAEEEMEAALRRTTEVHKSQLRQKEVELSELQRLLTAKERSIDSLRDTLAATKRTYEARLAQAESSVSLKEAEAISLQEELRAALMERDSLASQLHTHVAAQERELHVLREREATAAEHAREQAEDAARHSAALRNERAQSILQHTEVTDLRQQLDAVNNHLRTLQLESRTQQERLEGEVELLRNRLRTERGVRKACEKWLRSELKSREEMETLLTAIREAATGKAPALPDDLGVSSPSLEDRNLQMLLNGLALADVAANTAASPAITSFRSPPRERHASKGAAAGSLAQPYSSHQSVAALEMQSRKVLDDNRRLQAELAAAKRLLAEKLM